MKLHAEVKFRCERPEKIDDGDVEFDGLRAGNIATYTCRRGYKPIGETNRTCTVNDDATSASFLPEAPVCNSMFIVYAINDRIFCCTSEPFMVRFE